MGSLSQILAVGYNALNKQIDNHYTSLRDYQHASRIFSPSHNAFMPKSKNWFHIFFELDPAVVSSVNKALGDANLNSRINWNPNNLPILGVVAKTAKLPSFKFDVKKNNQYNRSSLTTTKINYDPVEITFWDDTIDMVRGFWYAYYQYMIQDPTYVNFSAFQNQGIAVPFQWSPSTKDVETLYSTPTTWGVNYGLDTTTNSILNKTNPFFRTIRIYQFAHQLTSEGPSYIEYVLVNPVITSFDHDTVDFSSSEFMQNRMNIECETVLYNSGLVAENDIASWDAVLQRFFDKTPSPLTGTDLSGQKTGQLSGVINSSLNLGVEIVQRGLNTGQATTATILTQTVGTASSIQNAINGPNTNQISVPTVVDGYGQSGLPPAVNGQ